MSLRKRILFLLSTVVILFTVCAWAIQRWVIYPGFERLEIEQSERDARRAQEAIENEIAHLDSFCLDWAAWDDTYDYCVRRNPEYVAGNLSPAAFENGNFALVYLFDARGKLVWGEYRDPARQHALSHVEALPARDWPLDHRLFQTAEPGAGVSGLVVTELGPFLVSSRPVLTSQKIGPQRGWLVMGLPLQAPRVGALTAQTRVDFSVHSVDAGLPDAESKAAFRELARTRGFVTRDVDDDQRRTYRVLTDIAGEPKFLLRAVGPRQVSAQARAVLRFALLSTAFAIAVVSTAFLFVLQRSIVSPISKLTHHVVEIGRSNDLSKRLQLDRADELGILSREFDAMVERLARSRAELIDAAREGGRSEVATNVLHDIGNVLNGVNVAAGMLSERFDAQVWRDLERVLELMTQHASHFGEYLTSDPKGRQLPAFLAALGTHLDRERGVVHGELRELREGLEHVRELIHAQQDLARQTGVYEDVSLELQIDAAWRITCAKGNAKNVEFRRHCGVARMQVHKHKLLQILVNLMRNAVDAVARTADSSGLVQVLVVADGDDAVRIEVIDDGVGIAPDDLTRIFNYGFSTKRDGHGFGLHSCALAAREMGGSLRAESGAEGRGARFVLWLPTQAPRSAPLAL